jgi:hypothetical protein
LGHIVPLVVDFRTGGSGEHRQVSQTTSHSH